MADKYNKQFLAYKTEESFDADVRDEKIDDSQSIAFVLEEGAEEIRVQGQNMKFVPAGFKDSKGLILTSDGTKPVWMMEQEIDKTSNYYGVEWGVDDASPQLTLVGKWEYCQSMPIQSGMYACIVKTDSGATTATEAYKLNPSDWDLDASIYSTTVQVKPTSITLVDESETYKGVEYKKASIVLSQTDMNNLSRWSGTANDGYVNRFKDHWVRLGITQSEEKLYKCYVKDLTYDENSNFTMTLLYPKDATIKGSTDTQNSIMIPGSDLTGWDGQVMVYVPGGYLHSEVVSKNGKNYNQVLVSTLQSWDVDKCETYSPTYVSAFPLTVLTEVPENYGFLSTMSAKSWVSCLNETYCKGTGNADANGVEGQECRSQILKPIIGVEGTDYTATFLNNLSYSMYKWLYWLMVIDYRTFEITKEYKGYNNYIGLPVGGLGKGSQNIKYYQDLIGRGTPIQNGATKDKGSGSCAVNVSIPSTQVSVKAGVVNFAVAETDNLNNVQVYDATVSVSGTKIPVTACAKTYGTNNYSTTTDYSCITVFNFAGNTKPYVGKLFHVPASICAGTVRIRGEVTVGTTVKFTSGDNTVSVSSGTSTGTVYHFMAELTVDKNGIDVETTAMTMYWDFDFSFENMADTTIGFEAQTLQATKWRSIESFVGQHLIWVDGLSSNYNTTEYVILNEGKQIGTAPLTEGYISKFNLGDKAELLPSELKGGSTIYTTGFYYPYYKATNWYMGGCMGTYESPARITGVADTTGTNGIHFGMIKK